MFTSSKQWHPVGLFTNAMTKILTTVRKHFHLATAGLFTNAVTKIAGSGSNYRKRYFNC